MLVTNSLGTTGSPWQWWMLIQQRFEFDRFGNE